MKNGIDISDFQTVTDYEAVKRSGVDFCIQKATEGVNFTCSGLVKNAQNFNKVGVQLGYYHFAHPGVNTAPAEAEHFWSAIEKLPRDIGVFLDLEVREGRTWNELSLWAQEFLAWFPESDINRSLYSNIFFLTNMSGAPWKYHLWLAEPQAHPTRSFWIWQHSWSGSVPGISGAVDLNLGNY